LPELPEVETVARQLAPLVCGRRIAAARILDAKLLPFDAAVLKGCTVDGVRRHGKQVLLELGRRGKPAHCLLVHLRMTGRLIWNDEPGEPAVRHLRAEFILNGGRLLFYDARRFGTLTLTGPAAPEPDGLDPTTQAFTAAALKNLLKTARQPLKLWLLRQDRLAGLGNIYASEILFEAALHPSRLGCSLSPEEAARLHHATREVLKRAIKHCGTTFSDFQDARGVKGGYQRYLMVYGRAGEPCKQCAAPIERSVQGQRATFYCPRCQVLESESAALKRP
jgi:formamidopyrimidine-DNA glycosylase